MPPSRLDVIALLKASKPRRSEVGYESGIGKTALKRSSNEAVDAGIPWSRIVAVHTRLRSTSPWKRTSMLTINLLWRTCTLEDDIKGKAAVKRLLHGIQ